MTRSVDVWRRGLLPALAVGAASFGAIGLCIGYPCVSMGLRYGMWLDQCPTGNLRLEATVQAHGLLRGAEGTVEVQPIAVWSGVNGHERGTPRRGVEVSLALLDGEETPVDGLVVQRFENVASGLWGKVQLPNVPDGDYTLRTTVEAPFETRVVDLHLPLYVPAIAHVMTDRPLYKPGQDVLIRGVLLERTDLEPLDGRPARWRIYAPDGTEMHVERTRAGHFGITETRFPLDRHAQVGTWRAVLESGDARDEVRFDVRPFQLPRLTVDLQAEARWYGIGDRVELSGVARYTSGAPVANAPVEVRLSRVSGRWPAPLAWEEPILARTGPDGTFSLAVGEVPADLIERATFAVTARVTEEAGETAVGGTQLVLSRDDLMVQAVTELVDGLVDGFNNRAYLRVLTPDGRPLPHASVTVSNPWDPAFTPREAVADEDAVVALQIDPGKPVTVVIPAPPVRVRPMEPDPPTISMAREVLTGRTLGLAERRALDAIVPRIAPCGDFTVGLRTVNLGVRVERGRVTGVLHHPEDPVAACVGAALRQVAFPGGDVQTWQIGWHVPDSLRPSLRLDLEPAWGDATNVNVALNQAALEARRCLPRGAGVDGATAFDLHWRKADRGTRLDLVVTERPGTGLSPAALACVRGHLQRAQLPDPSEQPGIGAARLRLSVPQPPNSRPSGPTTQTAYELAVAAKLDGARIGDTRVALPVGQIPPLRLRATPSIAHPGDEVTVQLLRGPDYYGDLPRKLWLRHGSRRLVEGEVLDNSVTFRLPDDADGFLHVEHAGARVVIFVTPAEPLSVALSTDRDAYRPGEIAKLTVTTRLGDAPAEAAVGLVGVDSALGQLAPLLGPDDWGRVTVRAAADRPAFDVFDPRALRLGQVRGQNAAQAAVLRIAQVPMDAGGDVPLSAWGEGRLDVVAPLTQEFYRALTRLVPRVRKWEATAPEGELMQPPRMVTLWNETLAELRGEGAPAVDAFGRELTLDRLPADLLEQLDPRRVVADGTRLPEDVISWTRFVAEEVGR